MQTRILIPTLLSVMLLGAIVHAAPGKGLALSKRFSRPSQTAKRVWRLTPQQRSAVTVTGRILKAGARDPRVPSRIRKDFQQARDRLAGYLRVYRATGVGETGERRIFVNSAGTHATIQAPRMKSLSPRAAFATTIAEKDGTTTGWVTQTFASGAEKELKVQFSAKPPATKTVWSGKSKVQLPDWR